MSAPAAAIAQQVVWKNNEVLSFAVSLVKHAVEKLDKGASHFTTDIVPDADRGSGPGIAGSVVTMLQNAGVLKPSGVTIEAIWYAHRIKSQRPGAKARYLGVYTLTSRALAAEFLERNQVLVPKQETQPELNSQLSTPPPHDAC